MKNTKNLTQLALFTALIMMLGFTPLGFITIFATGITTVHIPVILGSYIFSVKQSCYLGFIFGLISFIRCFTTPDAISAIVLGTSGFGIYNLFLIVAILFVPRILVGLFTNIFFKLLLKLTKKETISMMISAIIGSLTNTIFLLGGLFAFANEQTSLAFGVDSSSTLFLVLAGVVAINGIIEAIFASVISVPIGKILLKQLNK